jgi:hypothetical protein
MTERYESRLADLPVVLVHSCDGCGGTLHLDPSMESQVRFNDAHFGWPYTYCGKCRRAEEKREAAVTVQKGARCRLRSWPSGPFADLVVTAVDGDRITVASLGLGGVPAEEQRVILARAGWPARIIDAGFVLTRADLHMEGL